MQTDQMKTKQIKRKRLRWWCVKNESKWAIEYGNQTYFVALYFGACLLSFWGKDGAKLCRHKQRFSLKIPRNFEWRTLSFQQPFYFFCYVERTNVCRKYYQKMNKIGDSRIIISLICEIKYLESPVFKVSLNKLVYK